MTFSYEFPRPALTVDCVVFGFDEPNLQVMLIKRGQEPFAGAWALPGGFVRMDETLDEAALRELGEETGITEVYLEQLYTFGAVDRDPRGRVVTVAYYALTRGRSHRIAADTDAAEAAWFPFEHLPPLAFDHRAVLDTAVERLRGKVRYQPIGFELLPEKFKLSQLQQLYEVILGRKLDKRNFRKKINSMNLLEPLDEMERGVAHRAAKLYRFDRARYETLVNKGFNFEL